MDGIIKPEDAFTDPRKNVEMNDRNAAPVCPHCGMDPALYSMRQNQIGPFVAFEIFCGNVQCRKMYGVHLAQAVKQPGQPERRIIVPGIQ